MREWSEITAAKLPPNIAAPVQILKSDRTQTKQQQPQQPPSSLVPTLNTERDIHQLAEEIAILERILEERKKKLKQLQQN